jgi:hypothetical protein
LPYFAFAVMMKGYRMHGHRIRHYVVQPRRHAIECRNSATKFRRDPWRRSPIRPQRAWLSHSNPRLAESERDSKKAQHASISHDIEKRREDAAAAALAEAADMIARAVQKLGYKVQARSMASVPDPAAAGVAVALVEELIKKLTSERDSKKAQHASISHDIEKRREDAAVQARSMASVPDPAAAGVAVALEPATG